ncbi:hypothetical protein AHiyo8_27060 [Arthrobacter sp. Hiyo8]|nr:hypothetical protein AHiyo8_27060 [Arthrobacter sp. Hiyo8]
MVLKEPFPGKRGFLVAAFGKGSLMIRHTKGPVRLRMPHDHQPLDVMLAHPPTLSPRRHMLTGPERRNAAAWFARALSRERDIPKAPLLREGRAQAPRDRPAEAKAPAPKNGAGALSAWD